jgi:hypothetical protein
VGVLLAVATVAVTAVAGAQGGVASRVGVGADFAAARSGFQHGGNFIGPTVAMDLGRLGPVMVRVDGAVQYDPWSRFPRYASISTFREPYSIDERLVRGIALGAVAFELGTPDRSTVGGLFVAARVGGGASRWGSGQVFQQQTAWRSYTYHEPGFTEAVVAAGAEFGAWLPVMGARHRVAVRWEALEGRSLSARRFGFAVVRH